VEEILKGQVIIRSRAFATFSATEFSRAARKDLAGRMWPAGRMLAGLLKSIVTFDAPPYDLLNWVAFARCRRHCMNT